MTLAKRSLAPVLALLAGGLTGVPALGQSGSSLPLTQFSLQAQSVFLANQGMASSGAFFASGFTFILTSVGGSLFGATAGRLGQFNAMIDPIIGIDPSFARASEFSLFFSPDAYGSVAAVPEPETYSLLLAGLAVVAAVARRRRR